MFEPTDREKRIRLSLIAEYLRNGGAIDYVVEALDADGEVDIL